MEGKSALFKAFGGLDSIPLVLDTTDVDEIVETLVRLRPSFGAVNLEDISAPRCFELERRLIEALDCPVMHDDQHGTAIVVLAALAGRRAAHGRPIGTCAGRRLRRGRCGRGLREDPARRRGRDVTVLDSRGVLHTGPRRTRRRAGRARRNPRGLRRRDRRWRWRAPTSSSGCPGGTVPEELHRVHGRGRDRVRAVQPGPGGAPGRRPPPRGGRRHRPQRLPEPDQQRARVPGRLPRCAGCGCPPHHRADEARRGRCDLRCGAGRSRSRPDRAQPARPAGRARRRRRGGGRPLHKGRTGKAGSCRGGRR